MLVLLFVALWFILRGDLLYVLPCVILFLCFFSPFSIAITSLGEGRANLSAFRTFVQFVLVGICRFSLPLGVWEGLRFVIVAPPGLFSYLVLTYTLFVSDISCWDDNDCRKYDAVCNFKSKYSPNFGYECSCPDNRPYDKALKRCQKGRCYAVVTYSNMLSLR